MFVWAKSFKIKCKHRSFLMLKFIYLLKKNQNVSASSDRHHQLIKIYIFYKKILTRKIFHIVRVLRAITILLLERKIFFSNNNNKNKELLCLFLF